LPVWVVFGDPEHLAFANHLYHLNSSNQGHRSRYRSRTLHSQPWCKVQESISTQG
jgi:hypothetical protein